MDKQILANNILELSQETLECIKLLEKSTEVFLFDTETSEDLAEFLRIVKVKALRISNPKDKKDITKNIKRKEVYEKWQTTDWFSDLYNHQQAIQSAGSIEE